MLGVSGDARIVVFQLTHLCSDNAFGGRILLTSLGGSTTNTIESCIAGCQSQNLTVAGTEYSGMSFHRLTLFDLIFSPRQTNAVRDVVLCSSHLLTYVDCGNELANGAVIAPQTDCNMGCSGNAASVIFYFGLRKSF